MSGSQNPDAMDFMPTAPSPPSASPPQFMSQNMSDEEYDEHDPREWMQENPLIHETDFMEDYEPAYLQKISEGNFATETEEFDMIEPEIGQGVEVWPVRSANMQILHSSQKRTRRKRVVHPIEVLDSIPESQVAGSGTGLRGSADEKMKAEPQRSVRYYLEAYDKAMDEAMENRRELEGDAIRELPRSGHVQDGPCPLCHGGLCKLRDALDAFSGIPDSGFDMAQNESDVQSKGKGKARAVEEHEPGLQSKGKGKDRLMEEDDDMEEVDELGSLLAQAEKLYYVQSIDKTAFQGSKGSKESKSSGKQKSTQSVMKKTSRSKRPDKK